MLPRAPTGNHAGGNARSSYSQTSNAVDPNLTNPGTIDGQPFENEYQSLTFKAIKRMSDNWQPLGSYTWSRTLGWRTDAGDFASGLGDNPNANLHAYGRPYYDRPHLVKISGSYILSYDVSLGTFVRFQSGQPARRSIETQRRLNQGWVTVPVEPGGSERYPNVFTIDETIDTITDIMPPRIARIGVKWTF